MITLKISLGIFFLRVMVEPWQKYSVYFIITIATLIGMAYFFFAIFVCGIPVQAQLFWERRLEESCAGPDVILGISYAHGVISALTDLMLALLPLPMIKRARISCKEKIIVTIIFLIATWLVALHVLCWNLQNIMLTCFKQWFYSIRCSH